MSIAASISIPWRCSVPAAQAMIAALMKNSSVIETAESRLATGRSEARQPSSLTRMLRENSTTDAIVVPTMPAMSSLGLPDAGTFGTMPAASSRRSGRTTPAVAKNAKPITPTRAASTFRKNACRPTQYSPIRNAVNPAAATTGSGARPSAVRHHSPKTSTTIAITPMIEVICVAASDTITTAVTGIPKCRRNRDSNVSPDRTVSRLMATTMMCVKKEANASVHASDIP